MTKRFYLKHKSTGMYYTGSACLSEDKTFARAYTKNRQGILDDARTYKVGVYLKSNDIIENAFHIYEKTKDIFDWKHIEDMGHYYEVNVPLEEFEKEYFAQEGLVKYRVICLNENGVIVDEAYCWSDTEKDGVKHVMETEYGEYGNTVEVETI